MVRLRVAAAVVPVAGLGGSASGPDDRSTADDSDIPAYMVQSAMTAPERGILVVRGNIDDGLTYTHPPRRRGDAR